MSEETSAAWHARFAEIYGEIGGQRRITAAALAGAAGLRPDGLDDKAALFALQTYGALILEALSLYFTNPAALAAGLGADPRERRSFLKRLLNGVHLAEAGIQRTFPAFGYDWIAEAAPAGALDLITRWAAALPALLPRPAEEFDLRDPCRAIYAGLFPRNALHSAGEHYTPGWLASLCLSDLDYRPGRSLVDPFCGSGVFASAALALAKAQRRPPRDVLDRLLLIDINPLACLQAQTALLLELRSTNPEFPLTLPILNGDAFFPALARVAGEGAAPLSKDLVRWAEWLGPRVRPAWLRAKAGSGRGLSSMAWQALAQHALICAVAPCEVLATNPPWVGWEFIPRASRAALAAVWRHYRLVEARGRDKAFLKEDLATLAAVSALDCYLAEAGRAALVLKPALMKSSLAGRGLRRLSIHADRGPFALEQIRIFAELRPFEGAAVEAMTWLVQKGRPSVFPVPVKEWRPLGSGPLRSADRSLTELRLLVREEQRRAVPVDPGNPKAVWAVTDEDGKDKLAAVAGGCAYRPRAGLFTGGANAVFYLERLGGSDLPECSRYRNIVERAKRLAPAREFCLEDALVRPILRGRDIDRWSAAPRALILCPHTPETGMYPIPEEELRVRFPAAFDYLKSMRETLDARRGFSGWERTLRSAAYYALQRIGPYSFAPYKVVWRYIAREFVAAVATPLADGSAVLVNDKVVSIPVWDAAEAYYLCGMLSSSAAARYFAATVVGTQISVAAVRHLKLARFDPLDARHASIAALCQEGHRLKRAGGACPEELSAALNRSVNACYGL